MASPLTIDVSNPQARPSPRAGLIAGLLVGLSSVNAFASQPIDRIASARSVFSVAIADHSYESPSAKLFAHNEEFATPAPAAVGAPAAGLVFSPGSLVFGSTGVGITSAPVLLTVTNNTASSIGYLSSSNATAFQFQQGVCGPITNTTMLAPGASCTFSVTFTPTAVGPVSGSVTIGTPANPVTYSLSGTGVAAGLVFSPAATNFGNIGVGTVSSSTTITIYNYSADPAALLSSANLGSFHIQQTNCGPFVNGSLLAVGGSCTFNVAFAPTALGSATATATVGTVAHPVSYQVTGTGVPAGIAVTPAAPGFGSVLVGTTSPAISVNISNYTGSPINLLSSSNLTKFNIMQGACGPLMSGGLLAIGASCNFTATFSPTAVGLVTGTATVGTAAHPVVIQMTGTGVLGGNPIANAGGPYTGNVGQAIAFSGANSTAPSGQTLTYAWNFGDGTTGTGATPTHSYAKTGSFTASLTVTDSLGATNSTTVAVTVGNGVNPLTITPTVSPAPNAAGWNTSAVTVSFTCTDASSPVSSCPAPVVVSTSTPGQIVTGTAKDSAGRTATAQVTVKLELAPPTITATLSPVPNAAGWNNTPVTVTYTCTASTSPLVSCPPPDKFTTEVSAQLVTETATDVAGNTVGASVVVKVDMTPPIINISLPTNGSTIALGTPSIGINGTANDNSSGVVSLKCNNAAATLTNSNFSCSATLVSGANTISLVATDVAGNTATAPLKLIYAPAPQISIVSPANLIVTNISPITVNGTVSDPAAKLTINGISVPQSSGSFSIPVPLVEGQNILSAVATNAAGVSGTAIVQVNLDTTPPHITIDSPAQGSSTTAASITVSGLANDVVVGTVNAQDVQVSVNGVAAQVANRSYSAVGVPLALGPNTIKATGRDKAGNGITTSIVVNRVLASQPPAPAIGAPVLTQWLNVVSGNNQSGVVGKPLASPIVVSLTDPASHPLANQAVVFKVAGNNGLVTSGNSPPAGAAAVTTDSAGHAQVSWTLGQRSGAGNNVLQVSTALAVSPLTISATGVNGAATQAIVDSGNNQIGILGQPLPFPFVVDVIDAGHNRVAGVPVTFTVTKGGGTLSGVPSTIVNTDSNGRALVTLTSGVLEGINNNIVQATVDGAAGLPAAFVATAKAPGNPADTTISGVVLDNSNQPIQGVTVHLYKTNQGNANNLPVQVGTAVVTDAQGAFLISNAPVGFFKLMADGTTVTGTKSYPVLEYDIVTVSGTENTVGMPIYLPALDTTDKICVDETHGGTLTLPQYPGFSLTIPAGSATFPGGSRTGCVTATPVNGDKVPMSPGFGQQPRFIVTIQPVGTTFNPPAPITLPNVDGLRPKAVTEMYSYDHDLSMFVAIGTGTVTADGSQIVSDAGVGVIKAGWHCGGDPNVTGSAGTCPDCNKCTGSDCVVDPSQNGNTAASGSGCCKDGSVIPKIAPDYNSLVANCPNRTENPDATLKPYGSDGCSSPLGNNPAGGPDTAFGSVTTCTSDPVNCVLNPPNPLACEHHDFCYRSCKGANDPGKDQCDTNFSNDMTQTCLNLPLTESLFFGESCLNYASIYYLAVHFFGNSAFQGDQVQACKCCP